jgi:hypothetical protein
VEAKLAATSPGEAAVYGDAKLDGTWLVAAGEIGIL